MRIAHVCRLGCTFTTLALAAGFAMAGGAGPAPGANAPAEPETSILPTKPPDPTNPDWPCVQHKVETMTVAQMWDGPSIEGLEGWSDNKEITSLLPGLASRRVALEDAAASIKAFAEKQPPETRDKALTLLFAALFNKLNAERQAVVHGIERFQRRQVARSQELEREGTEIAKLRSAAAKETDKAAAYQAKISDLEQRYNWDARIFQERQQNIPLACEIPVLIEQRTFELAREIRSHMND